MQAPSPHFLLYSEASFEGGGPPRWKFVLQAVGAEERFAAADCEHEYRKSRLELLAVVRGLEALGQPSRVTLLTRSRYVRRGIRRELSQWRERRWRWERFGELVPIRDHDLWQRVDRALEFHQVDCCDWTPEDRADSPAAAWVARRRPIRRGNFRHLRWNVAAAVGWVRRNVLTPNSALWRPPFTRTA